MKAVWIRIHQVLGLSAGLFLSLMGLTGALMSFENEIMELASPGIVTVAPGPSGKLAPDALLARLKAERPDLVPGTIEVDGRAEGATRVRFTAVGGGRESRQDLYVDPYAGQLLGPARGAGFFHAVRSLHRWMLMPGNGQGIGRQITSAAAISLLVLAATGLYLRWPGRVDSWRTWFRIDFGRGGRALYWSLHAKIGTWLLPLYLFSAATGLWWSYDWYKDGLTRVLTGRGQETAQATAPPRRAGGREARPDAAAGASSLDPSWTAFLAETGGRFGKATIQPPAGGQVRIRRVPVGAAHPGARDDFRFDLATGHLQGTELYADRTLGEAMTGSWLEVHRGRFFGTVVSALFAVAAALMPLFAATGLLLYLGRRRARRTRPAARPAPGGARGLAGGRPTG